MKEKQDKDIDNLFKRGFEDPVDQTGFMEDDWGALEQMLDKGKKRRSIIFWLPVISTVAALLLLFFGWWMFRPQVTDRQQKPQQELTINRRPEKITGDKNNIIKHIEPVIATKEQHTTAVAATNNNGKGGAAIASVKNKSRAKMPPVNTKPESSSVASQNVNDQNTIYHTREQTPLIVPNKTSDVMASATNSEMPAIAAVDILAKTPVDNSAGSTTNPRKKGANRAGLAYHPQYALSVIASPELNGVNSLRQNTAGSNFGVLFSVGVLKKFTVSTGATYSTKPYATAFANYHTNYKFKTDPQSITADCRVLDIPINIDYQIYNKHRNKISIGSGLSSYIMMHESYEYNYADPAIAGPEYFNVKNPNKYLFSILNLQATYQHQINSKVGISLQPYFKLPLSTIGVSQVRLQTAGLAVGLNWNLNSLTKP